MVKLAKLREEEEEAEDAEAARKAAAGMEEVDEGSASRKRKLDELEEKKRVLEEENLRKQKEVEDEARRIRAVEEAERRAREQRSKNPKLQVPVAAEKTEKGETWFERKATELVESYIQAYGPQQKKSKEAAETYASACKDSERAQEHFISALQKTQETTEQLQKSMGKALEAAIEFGREEERGQLHTQAKEKCSRPEVPRVKARRQIPTGLQEKLRKKRPRRRKNPVSLGRRKELEYRHRPSQDHSGELVLENNLLKKNRERNGVKRSLRIPGKLEERSGRMSGVYLLPVLARVAGEGAKRFAGPGAPWGLPRMRMESCIRRGNSHGNYSRTVNSWISTTPSSRTTASGWYGRVKK